MRERQTATESDSRNRALLLLRRVKVRLIIFNIPYLLCCDKQKPQLIMSATKYDL